MQESMRFLYRLAAGGTLSDGYRCPSPRLTVNNSTHSLLSSEKMRRPSTWITVALCFGLRLPLPPPHSGRPQQPLPESQPWSLLPQQSARHHREHSSSLEAARHWCINRLSRSISPGYSYVLCLSPPSGILSLCNPILPAFQGYSRSGALDSSCTTTTPLVLGQNWLPRPCFPAYSSFPPVRDNLESGLWPTLAQPFPPLCWGRVFPSPGRYSGSRSAK